MKFSYNWLKRHLDTTCPPEEIAEGLTSLGIEVESCETPYGYLKDFKVAVIEDVKQHPDADKLHLCVVYDGVKRYNVVCGAHNVRNGLKVVLALPGVVIPDSGFKLKPGKIRGVESEAMMCSKRELKLGTDHDGIIEMPDTAVVGNDVLTEMGLKDAIYDISITPNRSDCFGVRGVAREAAAKGLGKLKDLEPLNIQESIPHDINIVVDEDAKKCCPTLATMLIRGVRNTESPEWLKSYLQAAGMNSISAIVDITNFVNLDLCRPLHAYDINKLHGDFQLKLANGNEEFNDLKGVKHSLSDGMLVSKDNDAILCLMGVIGGKHSTCEMSTTDILLEAAIFDPVYISRTGQKLNICTDSRTRFERGVDPEMTAYALQMAAKMITDLCGGRASEIKVSHEAKRENNIIPFSGEFFRKISGFQISDEVIKEHLNRFGFTVDESFNVSVPSYRSDVQIQEDLVEEVLRLYGYDHVEDEPLKQVDTFKNAVYKNNHATRAVRRALCSRGLDEAMNYSFISEEQAALFGSVDNHIELANPIADTMKYMRRTLLPLLISGYERIVNKSERVNGLFEVGNVFESISKQVLMAGGIRGKAYLEKDWRNPGVNTDVYHVKEDLFSLFRVFGLDDLKLSVTNSNLPSYYHPGISGSVSLGPNVIGYFGQIHPAVSEALSLKEELFVFECNIDRLLSIKDKRRAFVEQKLQNLYRDFAFYADKGEPVLNFIKAIKSSHDKIISVVVFDMYESEDIGENRVSIAVRITITQGDATMSDAEIQDVCSTVIRNIEKLGGEVRK